MNASSRDLEAQASQASDVLLAPVVDVAPGFRVARDALRPVIELICCDFAGSDDVEGAGEAAFGQVATVCAADEVGAASGGCRNEVDVVGVEPAGDYP